MLEGLRGRSPSRDSEGGPKYQKAALTPEEAAELQARLERAMETDRLYLDAELSLSDLAERLGVARNQLSYVINQRLGKSFYDLVNGYRVGEVLRLMQDRSRRKDKLITLAFDAGFNSKPTFNAVFKKLTGLTPSEYRRKNQ